MGRLVYDGAARLVVDDRTLAHLQVVMGEKMRRREPFTFTWTNPLEEGGGRISVWVSAHSAISYTFDRQAPHRLNRAWLDALAATANSTGGLRLVREPGTEDDADAGGAG